MGLWNWLMPALRWKAINFGKPWASCSFESRFLFGRSLAIVPDGYRMTDRLVAYDPRGTRKVRAGNASRWRPLRAAVGRTAATA